MHLLLGISAAAGAALCYDGAGVLQAGEARAVAGPVLKASLLRDLARRPRWVAATALAVAGWPLQVTALALAPLAVVQPTLAVGLVLLLVMGARLYGERVTRADWVASAAVLAGVVGLAVCAPAASGHAHHPLTLALVLGALTVAALGPPVLRGATQRGPVLVVAAGCAFTVTAIASDLLATALGDGRWGAAVAWVALCAPVAALGTLDEMGAMQRLAVARVAVPIFVVQTALPVALAPMLVGEHWGPTPGGGAGLLAALATCTAGAGWLARSPAVDAIVGATHAGDAPPA
ncbi:hypothetical protein NBH00_20585 [Paraconexibacter antarcticus]|uniref:Integral membrane protein n=1 Tax=Paraconexibacter antarcticus TaxID=2949664 RepID=A0ABY5DNX2_9ACTN|nr:hypothetical protein [Paraconexibacter antarcticus]UTI63728.1 hypothetical protein NBH00_20585 [Paraconexibacter antarcticus]